jgi:uncharacterized protein (TIGR02118 family)
MAATLMAIYGPPKDPAAFERHYSGTHVPLTKKIPGLRTFVVSRGPISGDSADHHLIAIMTFDDVRAMDDGLASPEGAAAVDDLANLRVSYVHVMRFESEQA